mgnify:CR=1 FL=1
MQDHRPHYVHHPVHASVPQHAIVRAQAGRQLRFALGLTITATGAALWLSQLTQSLVALAR